MAAIGPSSASSKLVASPSMPKKTPSGFSASTAPSVNIRNTSPGFSIDSDVRNTASGNKPSAGWWGGSVHKGSGILPLPRRTRKGAGWPATAHDALPFRVSSTRKNAVTNKVCPLREITSVRCRLRSVRKLPGSFASYVLFLTSARRMAVIRAERAPCPMTSAMRMPALFSSSSMRSKKSPPTVAAGW